MMTATGSTAPKIIAHISGAYSLMGKVRANLNLAPGAHTQLSRQGPVMHQPPRFGWVVVRGDRGGETTCRNCANSARRRIRTTETRRYRLGTTDPARSTCYLVCYL